MYKHVLFGLVSLLFTCLLFIAGQVNATKRVSFVIGTDTGAVKGLGLVRVASASDDEGYDLAASLNEKKPVVARNVGAVFKDCLDCPEMIVMPMGSFRMGDLLSDGAKNENPVHIVNINYSFAVGKFEVTQPQWVAVMGSNPSILQGMNSPVIKVSWDDIQEYLDRLNRKLGLSGNKAYRLLSEAEWEYVARAGSTTKYSWGNRISHENANYGYEVCCDGLIRGHDQWLKTSPVGSFAPNAWGLYDVHGNVWEWVGDCWNDSYDNTPSDGSVNTRANCKKRVLRGGSWYDVSGYLRSAKRFSQSSDQRFSQFGFRIAKKL